MKIDHKLFVIFFFGVMNTIQPMKRQREDDQNHWISHEQASLNNALLQEASNRCGCLLGYLLDLNADIEVPDDEGHTPLMRAVLADFKFAVNFLIERGAKINKCDPIHGHSALTLAVREGHTSIVKRLLKYGARINQKNNNERELLPHALRIAVSRGHYEIAELLLKFGAHTHLQSPAGWTPLGLAVFHGNVPMMQLLLHYGADINQPMQSGRTALMQAVSRAREDVIKFLLVSGADVTIKDKSKNTALYNAIQQDSSREIVKHLLAWVPADTIRSSKQKIKQLETNLMLSGRYEERHIEQMVPLLEQAAAHVHFCSLQNDSVVQPKLNQFPSDLLIIEMCSSVQKQLPGLSFNAKNF